MNLNQQKRNIIKKLYEHNFPVKVNIPKQEKGLLEFIIQEVTTSANRARDEAGFIKSLLLPIISEEYEIESFIATDDGYLGYYPAIQLKGK